MGAVAVLATAPEIPPVIFIGKKYEGPRDGKKGEEKVRING